VCFSRHNACFPGECVRILAIDDDPRRLASLRRLLQPTQFVIATAPGSRAALRMAMQNPPDLVLLNIAMPGVSATEFLRRLRRLESQGLLSGNNGGPPDVVQPIPVIFLPALKASHQRVANLDACPADCVTRPFDADELRARIRNQLRHARQHRRDLEHLVAFLEVRRP
jgi:DNA-binding response OmpR family regulator